MSGWTVHGLWDGAAVVEDPAGDVREVPLSLVSAIDKAIHDGDLVELDPCSHEDWFRACDRPAIPGIGDLRGRPVCHLHAPDDNPMEG